MAADEKIRQNDNNVENENGTRSEPEIQRPEGRYDVAIRFIDKFPLRLFTAFGLMVAAMHLMMHQSELIYVIPPTPFGAWFLTMVLGIMVFVEFIKAPISNALKRLFIKLIMNTEEKAAEL